MRFKLARFERDRITSTQPAAANEKEEKSSQQLKLDSLNAIAEASVVEVWENEVLGVTGDWIPAGIGSDDSTCHYQLAGVNGPGAATKHDFSLAAGKADWIWLDDWQVDVKLGMPYEEDADEREARLTAEEDAVACEAEPVANRGLEEQNKALQARVDELEDALMIKLEKGEELNPPESEPEPLALPPPEPSCDAEGWRYSASFDAEEEGWSRSPEAGEGAEGSKGAESNMVVRRRKLYRVQVRCCCLDSHASLLSEPPPEASQRLIPPPGEGLPRGGSPHRRPPREALPRDCPRWVHRASRLRRCVRDFR